MISYFFTLIQGFHQGCPLSMLLCIIVAKILAIFIDVDTSIKDIINHEIKMIIFTNDITIFFRDVSCFTK